MAEESVVVDRFSLCSKFKAGAIVNERRQNLGTFGPKRIRPHNDSTSHSPSTPFTSSLSPTANMAPRSYSKTYKVPRRPFESARLYESPLFIDRLGQSFQKLIHPPQRLRIEDCWRIWLEEQARSVACPAHTLQNPSCRSVRPCPFRWQLHFRTRTDLRLVSS